MPARPQSTAAEPSTYVFEMITFLTAYVDSVLIGLNEGIKTRAYASALHRIRQWLMVSRRVGEKGLGLMAGNAVREVDPKDQRGGAVERAGGRDVCRD
jgi:hypothetical protein